MSRKCIFTGKRPNVANKVSHSNRKSKTRQLPNLQYRKIWWPEAGVFVNVRLSTRAMRSIDKLGFEAYCAKAGIDLHLAVV
jgi:large subunit ribosomal protein L28